MSARRRRSATAQGGRPLLAVLWVMAACGTDVHDHSGKSACASCAGDCGACPGYLDLVQDAVGFARPTGGAAGPRLYVTTLADSDAGSLRAALATPSPKWISFTAGLTGTITSASYLSVPADTTIDGRGADITISGHGLAIAGTAARNIIVHNLKLTGGGTEADAVRVLGGATDVWIDHCSFTAWGDGAIDITNGAASQKSRVTVSWCHFHDGGGTSLVGNTADPAAGLADGNLQVTYHHNWFERAADYNPRVSFGRVHTFNNYLYSSGSMASSTLARLLVENNRFAGDTSWALYTGCVGEDCTYNAYWGLAEGEGGATRAVGNVLEPSCADAIFTTANESVVFEEFPGKVPPYAYTLQAADTAMRDAVTAGAGWHLVPQP